MASFKRNIGLIAAAAVAMAAGSADAANTLSLNLVMSPESNGGVAKYLLKDTNGGLNVQLVDFDILYDAAKVTTITVTDAVSPSNPATGFDSITPVPPVSETNGSFDTRSRFQVQASDETNGVDNCGPLVYIAVEMKPGYTSPVSLGIQPAEDASGSFYFGKDLAPIDPAPNPVIAAPVIPYAQPTISSISKNYWISGDAAADATFTVIGTDLYGFTTLEINGGSYQATSTNATNTSIQVTVADTAFEGVIDTAALVDNLTVKVDNGAYGGESGTLPFYIVSRDKVYVDDAWVGALDGDVFMTDRIVGANAFANVQGGVTAVNAAGEVSVSAGQYAENVIVPSTKTGIQIVGTAGAKVGPAGALNTDLLTIRANDVTVREMEFVTDTTKATVAIYAENANNISLLKNTVTANDAGSPVNTYGFFADQGAGAIKTSTIQGNTISGVDYGVYTYGTQTVIGGADDLENILSCTARDIVCSFPSGGRSTIENNKLNGGGSQVTEPNGSTSVDIIDNVFSPTQSEPEALWVNHAYRTGTVNVQGNTFNPQSGKVGVRSFASNNVTLHDNTFNAPLSGGYTHISIQTATPSIAQVVPNSATLTQNSFFGNGDSAGKAIEILNPAKGRISSDFGALVFGGTSGNENNFASTLGEFFRFDATPGKEANVNVDLTFNKFGVTSGSKLPTAMDLTELFSVEDKIYHSADIAGVGFARVKAANVYVTPNSASIQRGVNVAAASDNVNVQAGLPAYSEVVNVPSSKSNIKILGSGLPVVSAPASNTAASRAILTIEADSVTVDGLKFKINQPDINKAVAARMVVATILTNNTIENLGAPTSTSTYGFDLGSVGGPSGNTATVQSNTISGVSYGIYARELLTTIGGAGLLKNTIAATRYDILMLFPSWGASSVVNNSLNGGGLMVTEPNGTASVDVTGNVITPIASVDQAIWFQHIYTGSINVTGNTINVQPGKVGIFSGGSKNVTLTGNTFVAPSSGDFTHVLVDTLWTYDPEDTLYGDAIANSISVQGNTFNSGTANTGTAIKLNDALKGQTIGVGLSSYAVNGVAIGNTTANSFAGGLLNYVKMSDDSTKKFAYDVNLSNNVFNAVAAADLTTPQLFDVEDKIYHSLDVTGLGFALVRASNVYVTGLSGSIQRGVDAATSGNNVNVQAATYAEAGTYDNTTYPVGLEVNKAVKLLGPNAGVASNGSRGPEAVIIPGAVLNAGATLDTGYTRVSDWHPVVALTAPGATIDGFYVSGVNSNLSGGLNFANMTGLCAATGILSEADGTVIKSNFAENLSYIGIWSGGWNAPTNDPTNYDNVLITNNRVNNVHSNEFGYAFYMQGTTGKINNNVATNVRNGMQVQPYLKVGTDVEASGNTLQAWRQGLYYNYTQSGASAWTLSNNTITACDRPVGVVAPTAWSGIEVATQYASANGGLLTNNSVNGVAADPSLPTHGIYVTGANTTTDDLVFTGNTISNVKTGLLHNAPGEITFNGNNEISNTTIAAVDLNGAPAVVSGNNIHDNVIGINIHGAAAVPAPTISGNTFGVTSGKYIVNTSTNDIDIKTNIFDGFTPGTAPVATLLPFFNLANKLTDKLDGSAYGYLNLNDGEVFVPAAKEGADVSTPAVDGVISRGALAADAGENVLVQAGTYGNTTIAKAVNVFSADGDQLAIVNGTGQAAVSMVLPASGTMLLDGFLVTGGAPIGTYVVSAAPTGDNASFSINNCDFTALPFSPLLAAIAVDGVNQNNGAGSIKDCVIQNSGNGIGIQSAKDITIDNATVLNNFGTGIAAVTNVEGITVKNSKITNSGMTITQVGDVVTSTVDNPAAYGVFLSGGTGNTVKDSTIAYSAASGIWCKDQSVGSGITTITGNHIDHNGLSAMDGTIIPATGRNPDGLKIKSSNNVKVTNNYLQNNVRAAILVDDKDAATFDTVGRGIEITKNHISGSVAQLEDGFKAGLFLQMATSPSSNINAKANWWGHVYGPQHAGNPNYAAYTAGERGELYHTQSSVTADVSTWYGQQTYINRWYAVNDQDGDGIWDADEDVNLNYDPASGYKSKDSDGDTYEDGVEVALGSDPMEISDYPTSTTAQTAAQLALNTYAKDTTDADNDGAKAFYEVALGTDPTNAASTPALGDVNGDGDVNANDVTVFRKVIVSITPLTAYGIYQDNMDLNRDGVVTNVDVILERRATVGTVKLPFQ